MKSKFSLAAALVLVVGVVALGDWPPSARALSNPLGALEDFQVVCTSSATRIYTPATGAPQPKSLACEVPGSVEVRVGGSGVTASTGRSFCAEPSAATDCISGPVWSADIQRAWCISTGADVTLDCHASH